MGSFGENLRREREMRGITLAEIAQATKISARLLAAIETGRVNHLPGGIFNRSFVRQYARYLGLDEDRVVAEFEMAQGNTSESAESKKQAALAQEALAAAWEKSGQDQRWSVPAGRDAVRWSVGTPGRAPLIFAAVLGIAVLVVAGWKAWTILVPAEKAWPAASAESRANSPRPQAPMTTPAGGVAAKGARLDVTGPPPVAATRQATEGQGFTPGSSSAKGAGLGSPGVPVSREASAAGLASPANKTTVGALSETKRPATGTRAAASAVSVPKSSAEPLRLQVAAVDSSWVVVYGDGRKLWEAELKPGDSRMITARRSVSVRTGNAAGLVLTLNGETLPPLGRKGEVKTVTYNAPEPAQNASAGNRP